MARISVPYESVCYNCSYCLKQMEHNCPNRWLDKSYNLECYNCFGKFVWIEDEILQPDRSKREEVRWPCFRCETIKAVDLAMRCSEHCRNAVREVQ